MFQHHFGKKYYRWGLNTEAVSLENKDFLMKINVNTCTLENSSHIFSPVSGKLPPGKFPKIKLPPGEFTPTPDRGKFLPEIFPPMFSNIPTRVF